MKRTWIVAVIAVALGACGRSPLGIDADPDAGLSAGMSGGHGGGAAGASGASGHAGAGGGAASTGGASGSVGGRSDGGIAGTGDARRVLGESCAESIDCVSGHCVQGACCDSACDGSCFSCGLLGSVGRCQPVAPGIMCGGSPQCSSDAVLGVGLALCDGKGSCRPMGTIDCAPYTCDAAMARCRVTCASDADCTRGRCINGLCGVSTSTTGAKCRQDSECVSGFCTDGVCCNTRCSGSCDSCALPGTIGVCWQVPTGAPDPHHICVDEGAASCGKNGLCNSDGSCLRYAFGTMCSAPKCLGATLTLAGTCSTQGACITSTQSCAPAMCRTDQTGCQAAACSDANCPSGFYCVGADVCAAKKAGGAFCGSARECLSNVCSGGLDGGPGRCGTLI